MPGDIKYLCGLWHAHVAPSPLNNNGGCGCINCFGMHCHSCREYMKKAAVAIAVYDKTICQRCLEFSSEKVK